MEAASSNVENNVLEQDDDADGPLPVHKLEVTFIIF